jgi:hypothetical protein
MLAGCGKVCIRRTAHKSTGDDESLPSEGSRHRTSRSLHKIPTSARGVNSGARQSTCTVDASPNALNTSNDTIALRTTRVSSKGPSMMRRLMIFQHNEHSLARIRLTDVVVRVDSGIVHESWIAIEQVSGAIRILAFLRSCCWQGM